jgi:hypothetical protein
MFRLRLVAIRCSPVRTLERSSNVSSARQGREQRVLYSALCVLDASEDPVAVQLQFAAVGVGERRERLLVARARV